MKGFLVIVLAATVLCILAKQEPRFVVHLANIGARFPESINQPWIQSLGTLTHIGMRQLYLLGRELRKRYIEDTDLLDEQYNPNQLLIRAAVQDRTTTVLTGYALTRGLYVAGTGYSLSERQIQRAVPPSNSTNYTDFQQELRDSALPHRLASVPVLEYGGGPDYRLNAARFCPQRAVLQNSFIKSNKEIRERRKALESKFKDEVFKELTIAFGEPVTNMSKALEYRDYILAARHYAHKLNTSISSKGLAQLDEIFAFVKYEEYYANYMVARLVSHGLLSEIKAHVKANLATPEPAERRALVSYIIDDLGILAFLRLVEGNHEDKPEASSSGLQVPFASSLFLEMYEEEEDSPEISDSYKLRLTYNGQRILWNNKDEELSLNEFYQWQDANMLANFKVVCKGEEFDEGSDTPWVIVGMIMTAVLSVMVVMTCIYILKKDPSEAETSRDSFEEIKQDS